MRIHQFKIKIEMHWNATKREAYEKLLAWLEHNGHTSTGHGFDFKELDKLGEDE